MHVISLPPIQREISQSEYHLQVSCFSLNLISVFRNFNVFVALSQNLPQQLAVPSSSKSTCNESKSTSSLLSVPSIVAPSVVVQKVEVDDALEELASIRGQVLELKDIIVKLQTSLQDQMIMNDELKKTVSTLNESLAHSNDEKNHFKEKVEKLEQQMQEKDRKLKKFFSDRTALRNEILEKNGSKLQFFMRVRPMIATDRGKLFSWSMFPDSSSIEIDKGEPIGSKVFKADQIFAPDSTQVEVFESISALIPSALDGQNVCIIAYGEYERLKIYFHFIILS